MKKQIQNKLRFEILFLVIYLSLGFLWILFSDNLVNCLTDDIIYLNKLQTVKGFFYVLTTGLIFYFILKLYLNRLRKAKLKVVRSNLLKTVFLQNLSHEVRTPMNGIFGYIDLIRNNYYHSEKELHEYLDIIYDSTNYLLSTIEDIVEMAKIESGNIELSIHKFKINSLFMALFNLYTTQIKEKQNLILNIPPEINKSEIISDESRIVKVMSILINNAIKFTSEGDIEIGFTKELNGYKFFVKDSGIGIPPEIQSEIFERFSTANIQTTDNFGGMGLGLSIAKEIITVLDGEIKVESNEAKGSIFYFTLPLKIEYTNGNNV